MNILSIYTENFSAVTLKWLLKIQTTFVCLFDTISNSKWIFKMFDIFHLYYYWLWLLPPNLHQSHRSILNQVLLEKAVDVLLGRKTRFFFLKNCKNLVKKRLRKNQAVGLCQSLEIVLWSRSKYTPKTKLDPTFRQHVFDSATEKFVRSAKGILTSKVLGVGISRVCFGRILPIHFIPSL